jgi:ribulose-5-phosphate 4-epimerase/fuculose-1-phosphate aldolase
MEEMEIRNKLVQYARLAYERKLVRGTGGNFSARVAGDRMIITASGLSLGDTSLENLISVNLLDCTWQRVGDLRPSKEFQFHAAIFQLRPDVGAILHVHPPYATAYAVRKLDIPMVTDSGFKQPPMPHVPFAPSGTEALRDHVAATVNSHPDCKVLLMDQHGIAALGVDIVSAFNLADLTEELAMIAYLSGGM